MSYGEAKQKTRHLRCCCKHVLFWFCCELPFSSWRQHLSQNRTATSYKTRSTDTNTHTNTKCKKWHTVKRGAKISMLIDEHPCRTLDEVCSRDSPWLPLTHRDVIPLLGACASSRRWVALQVRSAGGIYRKTGSEWRDRHRHHHLGCVFDFGKDLAVVVRGV